jgi:hypothetical protein
MTVPASARAMLRIFELLSYRAQGSRWSWSKYVHGGGSLSAKACVKRLVGI